MKLTEGQRQHLFDLLIACDRPRPDSDALAKKGLAERGRGHFGEWVRITQKGIDIAKSWPEGERIAREARWVNTRASKKDSARTADRGGRAASTVADRSVKAVHQFMPAAADSAPLRRMTGSATPDQPQQLAPNTEPAPNQTARKPSASSQRGDRGADSVPNAVRVIRANKVTYYPLSMFGGIKDATKQRCRTSNRHYRSYALAASESDQVVL